MNASQQLRGLGLRQRSSSAGGTLLVKDKVPDALRNRLGVAVAVRAYYAYRELVASPRWQQLAAHLASPQRLLWGSTGTPGYGMGTLPRIRYAPTSIECFETAEPSA